MSAEFNGIAAAPGIAVGPLWIYDAASGEHVHEHAADRASEQSRLNSALDAARLQIENLIARAQALLNSADAEVFDTHLLYLDDPDYVEAIRNHIAQPGVTAEDAVQSATAALAAILQPRDGDLRDVGQAVLTALRGDAGRAAIALPGPRILIAEDITPAQVLALDRASVLGIATRVGSPASHAVIVARGLGIPMLVGVATLVLEQLAGAQIALLDADAGVLKLDPDVQQQAHAARAMAARRMAHVPDHATAITQDGVEVRIFGNITGLAEAERALALGAEGIGLFRTEFLYLERAVPPDEHEQAAVYRAIATALAGRTLTIRLADLGGDKRVPYVDADLRGMAVARAHPELLRAQLRAIAQGCADADIDLRVLLPMVASLEDAVFGRAQFDAIFGANPAVQFGVMIEVPDAARMTAVLASHVDFFAIGTNDLTRHTLANDPDSAQPAAHFHPRVLRFVQMAADAARVAGKPCSVCGEIAGDPRATPLLLGLGIAQLSMSAGAIAAVKARTRALSHNACASLATRALRARSLAAVLALLS